MGFNWNAEEVHSKLKALVPDFGEFPSLSGVRMDHREVFKTFKKV